MSAALGRFLIWLPIFVGMFIISTVCLGRIAVDHDIDAAKRWYPSYSKVLLDNNEGLLKSDLTKQNAHDVQVNALSALRRAPLSYRPFVQMGIANLFFDEMSENRYLFEKTLERNRRNRLALNALVNIDVSEKNYTAAIQNLDVLLKLKGEKVAIDDYHNTLLFLSEDKEARDIIDQYLLKKPVWGKKFLNNRIGLMTDSNYLDVRRSLEFFTKSPSDTKGDRQLHTYFLKTLQRMQKIETAFEYWNTLNHGSNIKKQFTVFNPKFEKRDELAPFNWREFNKSKYFSELDQDGGLYASYADNTVRVLTEQILRLMPGQVYDLKIDANWSYRQRQGMFFWVLSCIPSDTIISGVNLDDSAKTNAGGQTVFQVPDQDCAAQTIRLVAKPGQYSQRIWSRTNSLDITLAQ